TETAAQQVLGRHVSEMVTEEEWKGPMAEILSGRSSGPVETSLRARKACAGLDVVLSTLPKMETDHVSHTEGVVCLVQDVTALKASLAASARVAKEMRRLLD
ncbi:unnamed protein product, partial [Durusdinium trenchii]